MGYSRDSFYRFQELYEKRGELALQDLSRHKPNLKNRIEPEKEEAVKKMAINFPAYGQQRASNELKKQGITLHLRLFGAYGFVTIWKPSPKD
ncbi:winged helix-turn helix [Leptospira mayottensis 200901122]|uniref:Winged helix-turn helix n=1 Tax=Leptospira mayottensis 200901122 TaxID=1193010 RepID=A0AA87MMN5_9LEPT|nr:winged helix-turn helix [Leptospira mayottensis 200901122]